MRAIMQYIVVCFVIMIGTYLYAADATIFTLDDLLSTKVGKKNEVEGNHDQNVDRFPRIDTSLFNDQFSEYYYYKPWLKEPKYELARNKVRSEFEVYKYGEIEINNQHAGVLLLAEGFYSVTKIILYVIENGKSVKPGLVVGDVWGDAGAEYTISSKLKIDGDDILVHSVINENVLKEDEVDEYGLYRDIFYNWKIGVNKLLIKDMHINTKVAEPGYLRE